MFWMCKGARAVMFAQYHNDSRLFRAGLFASIWISTPEFASSDFPVRNWQVKSKERTQDWRGIQAPLEANCPKFTTSPAQAGCGDFIRIGPPGATDLAPLWYSQMMRTEETTGRAPWFS